MEQENTHSTYLTTLLKDANVYLFNLLPRESLFYEEDYSGVLAEGSTKIDLPSGLNQNQFPNAVYVQDTTLVGTDTFKYTLDSVSSQHLRVVTVTGRPTSFSFLTPTTLDFDAIADRSYTVTTKYLKERKPFEVATEDIDYPVEFTDFILRYAAFLYYLRGGFSEQAALENRLAQNVYNSIIAQEHNRRPYTYVKNKIPKTNIRVWWNSSS